MEPSEPAETTMMTDAPEVSVAELQDFINDVTASTESAQETVVPTEVVKDTPTDQSIEESLRVKSL